MNISTLESIVGPIGRGRLETGFPPFYEPATEDVPAFFSDDRRMARPPPLTEDLSHLNHQSTKKRQHLARAVWEKMTPKQRMARRKHLSLAGKTGGRATKDIRHAHGA